MPAERKMPKRPPAFIVEGIVYQTRFDASGYCKLTVELPSEDAARAAALAITTQTRFLIAWWPEGPMADTQTP